MSVESKINSETNKKALTIPQIRGRKSQSPLVPLVSLTAYTTPMAKMVARHCDFMLVGDSLGMVLYGMESTLGVSVDIMIAHGQAVMRGASGTPVIVDMPFGSYEQSPQQALKNASRIMKETGCAGVKLEGGLVMEETISFLTSRGVPVLAHIGLLPQSVNNEGGFRAHGHEEKEAERLREDARAVERAGAFATVIEGTLEPLAKELTEIISIPTIGIGASPSCDGQILVTEDMVGLFTDFVPRHVKRYVDLGSQLDEAIAHYAEDVKTRQFPEMKHCPLPRKKKS